MKKLSILLLICTLFCNFVFAEKLQLVATFGANEFNLDNAKQARVLSSNKRLVAEKFAVQPIFEIDKVLKEKNINTQNQNVLIAFETHTEKQFYSYYDFCQQVNTISPYIILQGNVQQRAGDTVNYYMKSGQGQGHSSSDADFTGLIAQLNNVQKVNVHLQISKMTKDEQKKYFDKVSLIFPMDRATNRWLSDIKSIQIYLIEKDIE